LASQLGQYRSQAAAKIAALASRATLDQGARQDLEELTAVLQAALAQVDVLSRQAALAEVLQHRISDQEDVLQQLQTELEQVDAQRVSVEGEEVDTGGGRQQCGVVLKFAARGIMCFFTYLRQHILQES
jgi:DNA repair exonuclease SbcCD ATPase subunit